MGWYTKVQMEFAYVKLIQKSGEKSKKSIQLLKDKKNVKKNHMNKTSIALLSVFLLASRAIELFEYLLLDTSLHIRTISKNIFCGKAHKQLPARRNTWNNWLQQVKQTLTRLRFSRLRKRSLGEKSSS